MAQSRQPGALHSQRRGASRGLRSSLSALLVGAALGFGLFTFGIAVLRVVGDSMIPTLQSGALVLVVRPGLDALLRGDSAPRSGDVVVLRVPGTGEHVVKRVVATGGHAVAMADGAVLIDGVTQPAPASLAAHAGHSHLAPVTVPDGHVFVLGDNRLPLASRDSRAYGAVPVSAVRGRVVLPVTAP